MQPLRAARFVQGIEARLAQQCRCNQIQRRCFDAREADLFDVMEFESRDLRADFHCAQADMMTMHVDDYVTTRRRAAGQLRDAAVDQPRDFEIERLGNAE